MMLADGCIYISLDKVVLIRLYSSGLGFGGVVAKIFNERPYTT